MAARAPAPRLDEPAASVIVPAYRASHEIAAALRSVFNQRWTDFEVVVVNDGSPDTAHLHRVLAPFRHRIRYLEQPNRGPAAARNAGIRASTGRFIAFLDSDDLWTPEFLQRQIAFLHRHPDCDLVYCDALLSGESPVAGRRFMEVAPSDGEVSLLSLLAPRCTIQLSTVLMRRESLLAAGAFDERLRHGEDLELVLRCALRGLTMAYQREVLAELWTGPLSRFSNRLLEIERSLQALERFGRDNVLPVEVRTALRIRAMALVDRLEIERAKRRVLEGNFAAARYHLAAPRRRGLRLRAALLALRVAPRLARRLYISMWRPLWTPSAAMAHVE